MSTSKHIPIADWKKTVLIRGSRFIKVISAGDYHPPKKVDSRRDGWRSQARLLNFTPQPKPEPAPTGSKRLLERRERFLLACKYDYDTARRRFRFGGKIGALKDSDATTPGISKEDRKEVQRSRFWNWVRHIGRR